MLNRYVAVQFRLQFILFWCVVSVCGFYYYCTVNCSNTTLL